MKKMKRLKKRKKIMFRFSLILVLLCYSPASAFVEQDCDIMKNKDDSISLGFKVGGLLWGVGPEISFRNYFGVNWRGNIQYMIAEYQELCSRYNTGRISKEKYDKEIKTIIERSRRYEMEVAEHFRMKKDNMFNEMEGETQ
jgi:hypothetical protein